MARSEPVRGGLLARHAGIVRPAHPARAPRPLRHLPPLPGRLTAPLPSPTARGKALQREVSALGLTASCEPADLWAMSRDCWPRSLLWTKAGIAPHPPDLVAWPNDVEQVAALVRFAAERQVAVVPFGAGSGVCGGTVPVRGGIALDLKRLTQPLQID